MESLLGGLAFRSKELGGGLTIARGRVEIEKNSRVMGGLLCVWLPLLLSAVPKGVGVRTLGVDYGTKRTGLAISCGINPMPLTTIHKKTNQTRQEIAALVAHTAKGELVQQVVMGMPYNQKGMSTVQEDETRAFARVLAQELAPIPVFVWDEGFTTGEARLRVESDLGVGRVQARVGLDAVAAAVILEDYFSGEFERAECVEAEEKKKGSLGVMGVECGKGAVTSYSARKRAMIDRVRAKLEGSSSKSSQ